MYKNLKFCLVRSNLNKMARSGTLSEGEVTGGCVCVDTFLTSTDTRVVTSSTFVEPVVTVVHLCSMSSSEYGDLLHSVDSPRRRWLPRTLSTYLWYANLKMVVQPLLVTPKRGTKSLLKVKDKHFVIEVVEVSH